MESFDPNVLEEKLAGDVATAKKRVSQFSTAVGVEESPDEPGAKLNFTPRAFRVKGKLLGQNEMADIDRHIQDVVSHLGKTSGIVNRDERMVYEQQHLEAMNNFRVDLLKKGLYLEQQMNQSRLDTETSLAMQKNFADLAEGAGFAFALKNRDRSKLSALTPVVPQAGAPAGAGVNAPKVHPELGG